MNAFATRTREPVENIFYASRRTMREGKYVLEVNNFCLRERENIGFTVEIDYLGTVHRFDYGNIVPDGNKVVVAEFNYTHKDGLQIIKSLPVVPVSKTMWGIRTQAFHKVRAAMLSPNFWDGAGTGNKHWFFMLAGCVNDTDTRGLFNEFLRPELDKTELRKVFEIVGGKMRLPPSPEQLSGLGFSSTTKSTLVCRVNGSRVVKIVF